MSRAVHAVFLQLVISTVFWRDVFGQTLVLTDVTPCSDGDRSQIQEIRVTPCNKEPCQIPRGEVVRMEVDFIANQNSKQPQITVNARWMLEGEAGPLFCFLAPVSVV
ncbi:uncharacterized protein LOC143233227 isoform X2 [Tachypleus tridentatus]|uniref:uncharacterized protein LOC143233227 isoform X2 n=1 Tax=Tachypleus tridentatus TaxID=6853 RepID=UPI003FD18EAC